MKPVLFDANETDFNSNGLGVLSSCVSCIVEEEANGIFDLEMEYPMDGIHFEEIADRCIIKAKPNHYRDPQLFRVYSVEKSGMGGIATIYAHHISYDLSGIPVSPFKAGNLQDALLGIKSHSVVENPFTFKTDKNVGSPYSVKIPKSARSAIAGSEGSLLQTYKGDLEFDNFVVALHSKRGQNRGVSIRYGKNLTDIDQDRNCESVYTGVYPFWASTELDDVLELPEKVVHADGEYPFTKILVLDFSTDFIEKPTTAQIRNKAKKYIKDNNIGKPDVSLTVEFAQMQESEEYKNLTLLEQVDLFDEVNVEFPQFGVSSTAKVVKVVYDAVLKKIKSVSLGSVKANISDTIVAQQKEIEETPKNSDLLRVQEAATAWLTNGKGYKVERRDELGNIVDTLYLDTPDILTAQYVLRIGQSGIGFSQSGVNGPYTSAWTIDGKFNADFIYAGTISSVDGLTKFDLQNGWLESKDPEDHNKKIFVDAGKLWLYILDQYAMRIGALGSGGQIVFVNPNNGEEIAAIAGDNDNFNIDAENLYLSTRILGGGYGRSRLYFREIDSPTGGKMMVLATNDIEEVLDANDIS